MFFVKGKVILEKYKNGDVRTKDAVKNSVISLLAKAISIVCSLAIVPLTIDYVNPTRYGIWLTLSGIIGWISFFDLGLGNGFRNRYAEAKANGNMELAREYLSTTYFSVTCIVSLICVLLLVINSILDWSSILNVDRIYKEELRRVFSIFCIVFCTNMVFNILSTLLSADQKPGIASLINGFGQILSLISLCILTKVGNGSLESLALFYSTIPCGCLLVASIYFYCISYYKSIKPSLKYVRKSLIRNILTLGAKFFIINLCLIMIFQIVNLVLSREFGSISVTQYNVASKYFNIVYMITVLLVSPLWSAYTDAYTKNDYAWMKKTARRMERFLFFSIGSYLLLLLISPIIYHYWIGDSVEIPFLLSLFVMILSICQSLSTINMYQVNGIGKLTLQLYVYIIFAFICWPLMVVFSKILGIIGVIIVPSIVYLVQGILARVQLKKIINKTATGIWNK